MHLWWKIIIWFDYDALQYSIAQYIARWCRLKTWPLPIITSRNFVKIRVFWRYHWKAWTGPIITMRRVHENKAIQVHSFTWKFVQFPYYHELKVTWIFGLSLISRGKIFSKIRQFCWCDLKIWPAPIIASSNFRKNKAVLMVSL